MSRLSKNAVENLNNDLLFVLKKSQLAVQDKIQLEKNVNDFCKKLNRGSIDLDQLRSELRKVTGREEDIEERRGMLIAGASWILLKNGLCAVIFLPLALGFAALESTALGTKVLFDKYEDKKLADESYQPKNEKEKKLQLYLQFKEIIKAFIENPALSDKPSSLNTTSFFQHRGRDNDQQDSIVTESQTSTLTARNPI